MAIKPLPRPVSYMERDGKTKRSGKIEREVGIGDVVKYGIYRKLLQEVQFDHRKEKYIRLGYYVKNCGAPDADFRWGSQTTFIITKTKFRKLLKDAKKKGII